MKDKEVKMEETETSLTLGGEADSLGYINLDGLGEGWLCGPMSVCVCV
jgi:hypothetical protein